MDDNFCRPTLDGTALTTIYYESIVAVVAREIPFVEMELPPCATVS